MHAAPKEELDHTAKQCKAGCCHEQGRQPTTFHWGDYQ